MANNNSNLIYGGDVMIFVGTTSSGVQPCAFSTAAKLTVNLSTREVSSKDSDDWSEFLGSKFDWSLSTDTLMNLSGVTGTTMSTKELYTQFVLKVPVYIAFASKTGTSPSWTVATNKVKFTGQAIITSMDMDASNGNQGTVSISLKGTGILSVAN